MAKENTVEDAKPEGSIPVIDTSAKEEKFLSNYKLLKYRGSAGKIHDPATGRDWFPDEAQLATDDEVTRLRKIESSNWEVKEAS